ncbi:MAG: hypothetical protein AB1393_12735 [Candidatus Edwardsbacteria bacterium]
MHKGKNFLLSLFWRVGVLCLLVLSGHHSWASDYEVKLFLGGFNNPYGLAVDAGGNIYVTDTGNNLIKKYSSTGQLLATLGVQGEFCRPQGIVVDSQGYIYVVDTGNNRIVKYDSLFNYVLKWGSKGIAGNQFNLPRDIAYYDGYLYVVDSGNHRILKFNTNGDTVVFAESGSAYVHGNALGKRDANNQPISGTEVGAFSNPYSIAVDTLGSIYVADTYNHRAQRFLASGKFVQRYGNGEGKEVGQLLYPQGVAPDNEGNVYLTDTDNNRIQKFSNLNVCIGSYGRMGRLKGGDFLSPQKICLISQKYLKKLYTIDSNLNVLQVWEINTYFTDVLASPNPFSPNSDGINDTVTVWFTIADTERVTVMITDMNGTPIRILRDNCLMPKGINSTKWDGKDENNLVVEDGEYKIVIRADDLQVSNVTGITLDCSFPQIYLTANPNPFSPPVSNRTRITFALSDNHSSFLKDVTLKIFKSFTSFTASNLIRTLFVSPSKPLGTYSLYWNGTDESGGLIADSVYALVAEGTDDAGRFSPC